MDKNKILEALRHGAVNAAGSSFSESEFSPDRMFSVICGGKTPSVIIYNPLFKSFLADLRNEADTLSGEKIPVLPFSLYKLFDTSGNRQFYECAYFERRKRFTSLAIASWLWEKREHITALEDTIWAICEEYSWCLPAHMDGKSLRSVNNRKIDLFAGETGFALAETLGMLSNHLDPAVINRANCEIIRRLIDSYTLSGEKQSWELMDNNWCAVCAGSIACASMYLIEDNAVLADILGRLWPVLDRFIGGFSSDGACMEGLSYWTYGVGFFTCFADMLFHRTAGAVNLLKDSGFDKIAKFQQYCYFPRGASLNFSDADDDGRFRLGLSCYLAKHIEGVCLPRINLSDYSGFIDHCGRFSLALRDLIWTELPEYQAKSRGLMDEDVRVVAMPEAQWLLCSGASQTGFAAKGGHNDEPHNHNDVGSFIFYKKGNMLLCDIGAGEYTKEYFSEKRYSVFCNSSLSHNLPVINGEGQKAGKKYAAKNCVIGSDGSMRLDLAPSYDIAGLDRLEREFRFDVNKGVLTLCDNYEFTGSGLPFTERFIFPDKPQIADGLCSLSFNDTSVSIRCRENVKPDINRVNYRGHDGKDAGVFTVDYHFRISGNCFSAEFIIS